MDPSEVEMTSHHEDSDNNQMPKVKGTKTRLNALDHLSKQVVDALAHQGERCEGIDDRLRHVEDVIENPLGEFRGSTELLSNMATLVTNMEELKAIVATLTDRQDTVILLKRAVA